MRTRRILAALAPLLIAAAPATGQKPVTGRKPARPSPTAPLGAVAPAPRLQIEITGGIGITVVNMDSWSSSTADDWGTINHWGAGRLLIPLGGGLRIGAEAGYHYHFWYTTHPAGVSYRYEYDVTATHVAGLVRLPLGPRFTADVGGGMHFFNNAGTHPGALAALTYHVPLGGSLTLPIGVRADAIFTDPMVMPIVLNAGLGFTL